MSDVSIKYKDSEIATLDDTGTKTIKTKGKYCEDDIVIDYEKSGGGGAEIVGAKMLTSMFYNSTVENIDLTSFDMSMVTSSTDVFGGCTNLKSIKFKKGTRFDKTSSMSGMFSSCYALTNIESFELTGETCMNFSALFRSCRAIEEIDLSNFDPKKGVNLSELFYDCRKLKNIKIPNNFITSTCTNLRYMCYGCNILKSLDMSNCNTSNVTRMMSLFSNCYELEDLKIRNDLITSKCTEGASMFLNCRKLEEIDLSNCITTGLTNVNQMFEGCTNLKKLNITNFDLSKITNSNNYRNFLSGTTPVNVEIITNQDMANWLNTNFPNYNNITIVERTL